MGPVERENLGSFDSSEAIDAPDLGEQAFGLRARFDGYPVYSYGWRNGDAVQLVTVAPNGEKPGPRSTVRLAAQLAEGSGDEGVPGRAGGPR